MKATYHHWNPCHKTPKKKKSYLSVGALGLGDRRLCVSWAQGPSRGLKTIRGGVNTIKGTHANG